MPKGISLRVLMALALSVIGAPNWAQDVDSSIYKTMAIKLGFYRMDQGEEGWHVSSGEAVSAGIGLEVLPILAVEVNASAWYPRGNDEYDFNFAGLSIGTNALLQLPSGGPYAKFGRHCWSANAFHAVNIWDGSGCSNTIGGGLLFNDNGSIYFVEGSRIRFKRVDSWFLAAGVRF